MALARKRKKRTQKQPTLNRRKKMADEPDAPNTGIPTPDGATLPVPDTMVEKVDTKNDVQLDIEGTGDGLSLTLYIRAPMLATVIRKMAKSNYEKDKYADVYKPILKEVSDEDYEKAFKKKKTDKDKAYVYTRAAIAKATKNFVGGTDFNFDEPPRGILLANPEALSEGYKLTIKLEKPPALDSIKRWGKQFMEGCSDIMSAARPYKYTWVMQQSPTYK